MRILEIILINLLTTIDKLENTEIKINEEVDNTHFKENFLKSRWCPVTFIKYKLEFV